MKKNYENKKELVNDNVTRHDGSHGTIPTPCGAKGTSERASFVTLLASKLRGSSCASEASYKCRGGVNSNIDSQNPSPQPSPAGGEGACSKNSGNSQSLLNVKHLFTYSLIHLFTCKRFAFTLAEVLVTLAVIGIVAAMTIPTLVQDYQEKVFVTGAKKFYSLISQAVQLAVIDNGLPETWDLSDPENLIKPLMPYLKITDYCTSTNGKACYNKKTYLKNGELFNSGTTFSGKLSYRPAFRLSDGTNVGVFVNNYAGSTYGEFMVDVNGEKGPNTYGKDIFIFNLAKNGSIKPSGDMQAQGIYTFKTGCLNSDAAGFGCAAWVVQNGNMDYWHCDDLSWDGKHKCSD